MVPDSESSILETVRAAIHSATRLDDARPLASDSLKELGLSRLRLLAVLIELEEKFDIEFPADAVSYFRIVRDITAYIQSHAMIPYDDADERHAVVSHPIERLLPARARLHQFCARALSRVLAKARPAPG
jgi:acyl carrier protein